MRRTTLYLCVGAVTALATACRDGVVEPSGSTRSVSVSPSFSRSAGNNDHRIVTTLVLSPDGGTYHVGDFDVVIPAGAVCDPTTTKYGVRYWDQDCAPALGNVTVNVVAERRQDGVRVDFKPDLRFRPSAGWVRIQTQAYSDLLTSSGIRQLPPTSPFFNQFLLLYAPSGKAARIDEVQSNNDASLSTHIDRGTGLVWRRVKHFSGYITAGYKCDPSLQTDNPCPTDDATSLVGSLSSVSSPIVLLSSIIVTP